MKRGSVGCLKRLKICVGQSTWRRKGRGIWPVSWPNKSRNAQGEEIVLGHSVERLCAAAAHYQPEFADKARRWSLLDGYYVSTRYPNGLPDGIPANVYTQEAALQAAALAQEAVTWVRELLKQTKTENSAQ